MPAGSAVVSVNAALGTSHKNVFRKKGYPRRKCRTKNVPLRFPAQAGDPMYLQLFQLRHFNVRFVFEDWELRKSFEHVEFYLASSCKVLSVRGHEALKHWKNVA